MIPRLKEKYNSDGLVCPTNILEKKKLTYDDYKLSLDESTKDDAIGLIYYLWKNNIKINTASDFNFKKEIKAKIGKFKISDNKVLQKLEIYKLEENKFIKNKP